MSPDEKHFVTPSLKFKICGDAHQQISWLTKSTEENLNEGQERPKTSNLHNCFSHVKKLALFVKEDFWDINMYRNILVCPFATDSKWSYDKIVWLNLMYILYRLILLFCECLKSVKNSDLQYSPLSKFIISENLHSINYTAEPQSTDIKFCQNLNPKLFKPSFNTWPVRLYDTHSF